MSSAQLSEEIGIPTKQPSKLRKENRFPFPFKNIGRLVYYLIYDVANFLLNGEITPSQEAPAPRRQPVKKEPAKPTASVQDLSRISMLRAFAKSLEERATAMVQFAENLKDYASKKEIMENFQ
jgi:hypothetical protein